MVELVEVMVFLMVVMKLIFVLVTVVVELVKVIYLFCEAGVLVHLGFDEQGRI